MHIEPLLKLGLELCKSVSSIINGMLIAVYVGVRRCERCARRVSLTSRNNPVVHLLEASNVRALIGITSLEIIAPIGRNCAKEVTRIGSIVLELPALSVRARETKYVFGTLIIVEVVLTDKDRSVIFGRLMEHYAREAVDSRSASCIVFLRRNELVVQSFNKVCVLRVVSTSTLGIVCLQAEYLCGKLTNCVCVRCGELCLIVLANVILRRCTLNVKRASVCKVQRRILRVLVDKGYVLLIALGSGKRTDDSDNGNLLLHNLIRDDAVFVNVICFVKLCLLNDVGRVGNIVVDHFRGSQRVSIHANSVKVDAAIRRTDGNRNRSILLEDVLFGILHCAGEDTVQINQKQSIFARGLNDEAYANLLLVLKAAFNRRHSTVEHGSVSGDGKANAAVHTTDNLGFAVVNVTNRKLKLDSLTVCLEVGCERLEADFSSCVARKSERNVTFLVFYPTTRIPVNIGKGGGSIAVSPNSGVSLIVGTTCAGKEKLKASCCSGNVNVAFRYGNLLVSCVSIFARSVGHLKLNLANRILTSVPSLSASINSDFLCGIYGSVCVIHVKRDIASELGGVIYAILDRNHLTLRYSLYHIVKGNDGGCVACSTAHNLVLEVITLKGLTVHCCDGIYLEGMNAVAHCRKLDRRLSARKRCSDGLVRCSVEDKMNCLGDAYAVRSISELEAAVINNGIVEVGCDTQVGNRDCVCKATAVTINVNAGDLYSVCACDKQVFHINFIRCTILNRESGLYSTVNENFTSAVAGRNVILDRSKCELENHIVASGNTHSVHTIVVYDADCRCGGATTAACRGKHDAFANRLTLIRQEQLVLVAFLLQDKVVNLRGNGNTLSDRVAILVYKDNTTLCVFCQVSRHFISDSID